MKTMRSRKVFILVATILIATIWLCRRSFSFSFCSSTVDIETNDRVNINHIKHRNCKLTSEYVSSSWERTWIENIAFWKSDERNWSTGCGEIRKDKKYLDLFQDLTEYQLDENFLGTSKDDLLAQVFSYHRMYDSCTKRVQYMYIEPLVSFLRHPAAVCFRNDTGIISDKSYIILPSSKSFIRKEGKNYLFDVGASVYDSGLGGDSQKWFIENYRAKGIEFDHIYGWEAKITEPSEQWNSMPPEIMRKTSWYNIPANSEKDNPNNPWTFVREITKAEDFVAVKIDIDNPEIEIELVLQLLNDPVLLDLVDEFYFEHHVHGSPMQYQGWGDLRFQNVSYPGVEHSYKIFETLRERGVRAHSWV